MGLSSSTMAEVVLPPLEVPSSDPPPQPPVLLLELELLLELLEPELLDPELEPELELLELDPELLELEPELELLDPLELLELLLLPGVSPPPVLGRVWPCSSITPQLEQWRSPE